MRTLIHAQIRMILHGDESNGTPLSKHSCLLPVNVFKEGVGLLNALELLCLVPCPCQDHLHRMLLAVADPGPAAAAHEGVMPLPACVFDILEYGNLVDSVLA